VTADPEVPQGVAAQPRDRGPPIDQSLMGADLPLTAKRS
jgi:hypothetical protein